MSSSRSFRLAFAILPVIGSALLIAATGGGAAPPRPRPTLTEALRSARQDIGIADGSLTGSGAVTLDEAIAKARLIAVGEDHVTREIPAFVSALCKKTAPELSGLVLEAGPRALEAISPALHSRDRIRQMEAFNRRYPSGIAFLDSRADNDMAAECLALQPRMKLVGIDQEFLGSAGLLIDLILREHLSAPARQEMTRLRRLEEAASSAAAKSGNPGDLLLVSISPTDLERARRGLATGGTQRARMIFGEFERSREMFLSKGNASNQDRALLLKSNLRAGLPAHGKVIFKMGDWHLYRGYNPLNNRDVGNWVAERADEEGQASLHILILGEKGVHALYGGYERPLKLEPFVMTDDPDYKWLRIALDARGPARGGTWDMFDLRGLRDQKLADMPFEWRRVLDGYDFLILIPELTPSSHIDSPAR